MCGIAGFQGSFDPALLARMNAAQAHRGPDGEGTAVLTAANGARTGLAHRRLAIIDLSADGAQPMTVHCARCRADGLEQLALSFNGEIYNYEALRRELEGRGHRFHSQADSEVLLHLFAERGPAMLDRLNGIFALAIHDGRATPAPGCERGDLFLARDPMGVKPLYWSETPRGVLFASEAKALLAAPDLRRDLDLAAVHFHLAYLWCPAPRTALAGVQKLEPGHAMLLRGGRVARRWSYDDLPYDAPVLAPDLAGHAEAVGEAVAEAVRRQLVSDVPVGAFLSGGLDSSAVVAMMRRADPSRRPVCYCIGFEGLDDTEGNPADLPFAQRVAAHVGAELRPLVVRPDIIARLPEMLWLLDEPQADPAPLNALLIASEARRDGIPVLLSGAGGDDIFSGYRRHWALAAERWWGGAPRPMRLAAQSVAQAWASGAGVALRMPVVRRAAKLMAHAGLDPDPRLVSYFWWSTERVRRGLYAPRMREATAGLDTAAPLLASLARVPSGRAPLDRMLYLETRHFLPDHNLNYTDKAGMASGVEVRVPLLDADLVALAARIPPAEKLRGGVTKAVFKRAMERFLPHDVIHRPKSGFGAPLRRWLSRELRPLVDEALSPAALRRRELFDPAAVARLVQLDRAGRIDGAYTIFALLSLELWCRRFID